MTRNNTRNMAIIRMRRAGDGPRHIAKVLAVSPGVVSGVLTRAGLCASNGSGRGNRVDHASRARIVREALAAGYDRAAARWSLHPQTVRRFVREAA